MMKKKPMYYWTYEKCKEKALKYNTKKDFERYDNKAFKSMYRNKFLDVCSHMLKNENDSKRCIYSYEFDDNSVYVGLTNDHKKRNIRHKKENNSSVFQHNKICSGYTFNLLTEYIDMEDAKNLEGEYVEKYRNEGWNILNKVKTGSVGGNTIKWTKEKCIEETQKYNTLKDLYTNSATIYHIILKNNWYDEICSHLIVSKKNYWSYDECKKETLKYKNITDFRKNNRSVYNKCLINGWDKYLCSHMDNRFWTKEKCQKESLKYNSKNDFSVNSTSSYRSSLNNGWLDEICSHMEENRKPNGYWTKEKCQEEALKHETKHDFEKMSSSAYQTTNRNNWTEEICSHMIRTRKKRIK